MNVLTNLIPDAYAALDQVSRELVGFTLACTRDTSLERVAVGQLIRSPVVPRQAATDITPGVTPPNDGQQTIGNKTITITKSRRVPFVWNGEESRGLNVGGPGQLTIQQDQIAQAMRELTNEAEADLAAAANLAASRAYGTAGTTPFGTAGDWSDTAQVLKILKDNGCPQSDLQMVINTAAGASTLGKQSQVQQVGTRNILTQGVLENRHGFQIRESAQVVDWTAGTAAGSTTNNAGYAVGATVITLASAGTGIVKAGDVVTFAGDTNKYVVETGDTDVSNGGTITLRAPGLRKAIAASATAITVVGSHAANMAFRRSALHLIHRLPALPPGGRDLAIDRTTIQDTVSGLVFEIAAYPMYRQIQYEISAAWGVGSMKDEHIAKLLG